MFIDQSNQVHAHEVLAPRQNDLLSSDIETALMMTLTRRINKNEQQIADLLRTVQEKNRQITKLNAELEELINRREQIDDPESDEVAAIDARVSVAKSNIDTLVNIQQKDLIRLQAAQGSRNEAFETLSALLKKIADAKNGVLGKMG